jgi:hypothetical protein
MKRVQALGAIALAFAVTPAAWAAGKPTPQAQQQYQQERAHCMSGNSQQDRATCLKEAGAAYDEARRGNLNDKAGADLSRNATERCNAQPAADREACVQRVIGAGTTQGSVKAGGLIRETETKVK